MPTALTLGAQLSQSESPHLTRGSNLHSKSNVLRTGQSGLTTGAFELQTGSRDVAGGAAQLNTHNLQLSMQRRTERADQGRITLLNHIVLGILVKYTFCRRDPLVKINIIYHLHDTLCHAHNQGHVHIAEDESKVAGGVAHLGWKQSLQAATRNKLLHTLVHVLRALCVSACVS